MRYPVAGQISQNLSPNFSEGRDGHPIKAIVVHKGEGGMQSIMNEFLAESTQKSAHFVIDYWGNIVMMVDPKNTAWHTGVVVRPTWPGLITDLNPNLYTIGIELEGYAATGTGCRQLGALSGLIAALADSFDLPINEETIVFHREIDGDKTCPGGYIDKVALMSISHQYFVEIRGGVTFDH